MSGPLVPLSEHPLGRRRAAARDGEGSETLGAAVARLAPADFRVAKGWTAFLAAQKSRHRTSREAEEDGARVPLALRKRSALDRLLQELVDLDEAAEAELARVGQALRAVARRRAGAEEQAEAAASIEAGLARVVPPVDPGPYRLEVRAWPRGLTEEQQRRLLGRRPETLASLTAREAAEVADYLGGLVLGGRGLDVWLSLPAEGQRFPVPAKRAPPLRRDRRGPWLRHTDEVGRFSLTPEGIAREQAAMLRAARVVDAFGGLGGNAVAFAEAGKEVRVLERDPVRRSLLGQNISERGLRDRVALCEGAVPGGLLEALADWPDAAVFLDPPWGGTEAGSQHLTWEALFPEQAAWAEAVIGRHEVLLKLPRAFDVETLPGGAAAWELRWHLGEVGAAGEVVVKVLSARRP